MIRVLLLLLMTTSAAAAGQMTFFMKNENGRAVVIELFGEETGTRWPGDDKVYLLESKERKSVPIECREGERICYGAWLNGDDRIFWGVGPDNDRRCDDCCVACAEKTTEPITIE